MKYNDFVFLNVPMILTQSECPPTGRLRRLGAVWTSTQVGFLIDSGLLRDNIQARRVTLDQVILKLSDFTEEGQDFIMSNAIGKWLGACDRKSNDLLKCGASEEERLAVYANPKGLYSRLERFRKARSARAN